jgi:hypothetical protein
MLAGGVGIDNRQRGVEELVVRPPAAHEAADEVEMVA